VENLKACNFLHTCTSGKGAAEAAFGGSILPNQPVQSQGYGDGNKGNGDHDEACLEEFSLEGVHK
jgi:hypothetical protein